MPDNLHYCPAAWALYDIWAALVDDEAGDGEVQEAYRALLDHRAACEECKTGVKDADKTD